MALQPAGRFVLAEAFGHPQAEAVKQRRLCAIRAHHAANSEFALRVASQGQDYVGALDATELVENGT